MKNEKLICSIGNIEEQYISEAAEIAARRRRRVMPLRKAFLVAAAVAAALLLCGAAVYVISGGDLWLQKPSDDPETVVREALEQQTGKDYTISIQVESVVVDPDATVRVRDQFISGPIAERRGWSDKYLEEHFVVVKAAYHAEYDHVKTTRSDGDVVMYFYLTRDVDSGKWSIVDNSGNMNLTKRPAQTPETKPSLPVQPMPPSIQKQIEAYLSELFTRAYSPYYDGLHYEIRQEDYQETVEDGVCTATFLWTMYNLEKGWDVGSDEGLEGMMNISLRVTVEVSNSGELDLSTISVLTGHGATGPMEYSVPVEQLFPNQLEEQ